MTEEDNTDIKVFGNDDESLRILGQLLSSETSRKIIQLLIQEEMYTNQISKKLGIQMNTILFHIKKLADVGLVTVTHKQIIKKGIDHKYYKMVPNIFVTATQSKKEVHENGFLKKFFKEGIKFVAIGITGLFSFLISNSVNDNKWSNAYQTPSDPTLISIIIGLVVVIIGLIIYIKFKK